MNKRGKKVVSLSEIAILVLATFAFAYILNEAFSDDNIVSASEELEPAYTCLKSKEGKICQEYKASECNDKCDGECIAAQRSDVASCRLGTCFDKVEGTCQTETPKGICENFEGQWFDDPYGNIPECETGCCLLGNQTAFTTSKQCDRKSELLGVTGKYDSEIRNELSCLALANQAEEGACVSPPDIEGGKNNCAFITKDECSGRGGTFYSGYLCSNTELNTKCTEQKTTNCVEEKDEIYWFDSCGNRENIYDIDKTKSWNEGMILSKMNSCSIFSKENNIANQDNCGNCMYVLGSKCGKKTSDESLTDSAQNVVCRDLSCIDEEGNRREFGESWCAYQSSIGTDVDKKDYPLRATDVVGSRHFRKICIDGEVQTEPCADYRGEICVENRINLTSTEIFTESFCKINRWQECLLYNKDVKTKGKGIKASVEARDANCTANTDCFLKKVDVDEEFQFDVCVPRYPVGFEMQNYAKVAEDICNYGSQKCTVVYINDINGWMPLVNEDCEDVEFTQQMNDLCMSLGDCGAEANIAGDITYNYKVKGAPKLVKNKKYNELLLSYATPVEGKYALPGNLTNELLLGALAPVQVDGEPTIPQSSPYGMVSDIVGGIAGGLGGGVTYMANYFARADNVLSMFKQGNVYNVGTSIDVPMTGYTGDFAKFNGIWKTQPQFFIKDGGVYVNAQFNLPDGSTGSFAELMIPDPSKTVFSQFNYEYYNKFGMEIRDQNLFGNLAQDANGDLIIDNGFVQLDPTKTNEFLQGASSSSAGKIPAITDAQTGQVVIDPQAAASKLNMFTTAMNAIGVASAVFSLAMAVFGPGPKLMGSIIQSGIGLILAILPLAGVTLGPFGAIISILVMIIFKLMKIGEIKKVVVSYTCQPWQAPVGGDNCKKCGEEFPCSKYACRSLGQTCEFINEGSDNELCINVGANDSISAKITPYEEILNIGFSYEDISDNGYRLNSNENDGCIKAYQNARFGINTNEVAQCKLDVVHTDNFEDMEFDFGISSLYLYNHSMDFLIPSLESLGIEGYDPNAKADYKFYVRCQDKNGNINENEYVIDFCIKPGDDVLEPIVLEKSPETENIAYATAEQGITLYVNEPAECRWDITNKIYGEMLNQMDCDSNITEQTSKGWSCFAELPTSNEENNYFVRCIDQPWYAGVNESKRNTMSTSYNIKLKKTPTTLTISSAYPDGETLNFGSSPYSFRVTAETSGGYDNGNANCYWMIGNQQILFDETGGTTHKRLFNQFGEGNGELSIRCIDGIGNTADKTIHFTVGLDEESPLVTRVYSQGGNLIVITNEDSECTYSLEGCNYNYADGTAFSNSGTYHSVRFVKGLIHYVKCKDSQGNMPGDCSVVVKEA